jgi:hypothetical protein
MFINIVKHLVFKITLFILGLTIPIESKANHLITADIGYRYVNDTTYEITIRVYLECDKQLPLIGFNVYNYDSLLNNDTLIQLFQGIIDSPSIRDISNNCDGCSNPTQDVIPILEYTFKKEFTFPRGRWLLKYRQSGRYEFNNLDYGTRPSQVGFNTEILLDNTKGSINDSPLWYDLPIIYICPDNPTIFNFRSSDNDSIVITPTFTTEGLYNIIIPFSNGLNISNPVNYRDYQFMGNGFSFIAEKEANILTFIIDEYRNDILISTGLRDIAIIPYPCDKDSIPDIYPQTNAFSSCLSDSISILILGIPDSALIEYYGPNELNLTIDDGVLTYKGINQNTNIEIAFKLTSLSCPFNYTNYFNFEIQVDTLGCLVNGLDSIKKEPVLLHVDTLIYNMLGQYIGNNELEFVSGGLYIYRLVRYYQDGLVEEKFYKKMKIK